MQSDLLQNAEPMHPVYLKEGLLQRKQAVYRYDRGDVRIYYTVNEAEVTPYGSVTSIIKQGTAPSPYLIKWWCDYGYEGAKRLMNQKAEYGRLMHLLIAEYLEQGSYNLNMIDFVVRNYARENRLNFNTSSWGQDLRKDLLSFAKFCDDFKVKPLAVEMVVASKKLGYAGCVDMVCEMTIEAKGYWGEVYASGVNKGQPKESKAPITFNAIIDFKSGKHSFFDSNEIQANMYLQLWNECYPEVKVDRCYNWRPSDWDGTEPTYNIKDQTGSKLIRKIPHLVQMFAIDHPEIFDRVLVMDGVIKLGQEFDGIIERKPAQEVILSLHYPTKQTHFGSVSLEDAANGMKSMAGAYQPFEPSHVNGNGKAKGPAVLNNELRELATPIESSTDVQKLIDTPPSENGVTENPAPIVSSTHVQKLIDTPPSENGLRANATPAEIIAANRPPEPEPIPHIATFMDDDPNDEVIQPAPETPVKPISPTLDALKSEMNGEMKGNMQGA